MKKHYYLAAAKIVFVNENEGKSGEITVNALYASEDNVLKLGDIGKTQQNAQMVFRQRQPDPAWQIVDVIILNLTHLGHMTKEEFEEVPEGMELREIEVPVVGNDDA